MKLKLIGRQRLFDDVETFVFKPEQPVDWQPGQYMHYVFAHADEDDRGEERWFTISAPPYQKNLSITTRFTAEKGSTFKKALRQLKPGVAIEADGPKGKFVIDDFSKKYVLIAGGIGITPYRSMLMQFEHDGRLPAIDLLWANRDDDFVFGNELSILEQKYSNFHIHKFVGGQRMTEADFQPYADDPDTIFYVSGPEPMVENYADMLKEMDLSEERVKTDFFPGY